MNIKQIARQIADQDSNRPSRFLIDANGLGDVNENRYHRLMSQDEDFSHGILIESNKVRVTYEQILASLQALFSEDRVLGETHVGLVSIFPESYSTFARTIISLIPIANWNASA